MLVVCGCAYLLSAAEDSLQFGVIALSKIDFQVWRHLVPHIMPDTSSVEFHYRDERLVCEDMLRISDDINTRYAEAFRALARSEAKDRENELLFGFERNAWKNQT